MDGLWSGRAPDTSSASRPARGRRFLPLNDISHRDDEQHDPYLEAFDDIGARELKEIVLLEALEDRALISTNLIRYEESQEGV